MKISAQTKTLHKYFIQLSNKAFGQNYDTSYTKKLSAGSLTNFKIRSFPKIFGQHWDSFFYQTLQI